MTGADGVARRPARRVWTGEMKTALWRGRARPVGARQADLRIEVRRRAGGEEEESTRRRFADSGVGDMRAAAYGRRQDRPLQPLRPSRISVSSPNFFTR
jgi:hypothetical protein